MKKYLAVKENNKGVTHLKIELCYNLGGMNYFTYKKEARGYYLSVVPVERQTCSGYTMESFVGFSGIKECIKTVKRKSKKAELEAEQAAETVKNKLIEYVLTKNELELA